MSHKCLCPPYVDSCAALLTTRTSILLAVNEGTCLAPCPPASLVPPCVCSVAFTTMCGQVPPSTVYTFLNELFSKFDDLTELHGVYKVETIGGGQVAIVYVGVAVGGAGVTSDMCGGCLPHPLRCRSCGTACAEGTSWSVPLCTPGPPGPHSVLVHI